MWRLSWVVAGLGSLAIALLIVARNPSTPESMPPTMSPVSSQRQPNLPLQYKTYSLAHSTVHTLLIPAQSSFAVVPALSESVDTLDNFAQQHGAIAVLNGGFFDPTNQKSTSYVVVQGKLVAEPKQNERLVNNPDLSPYLNQIFNRTELRRYQCGSAFRYDIAPHNAPLPANCQLIDALGGGPRLLLELTAQPEGFVDTVNGEVIRDPLGSNQPNARTAIALTQRGDVVWVMVAQKSETPADSGMTFTELIAFLKTLGIEQAMNLDGGSSSSFYYQGKTWYGKVDPEGYPVQRPVKSVFLVLPN
ncbi:phosphodiester glycosidase family protein [Trichocoleus sp. FACHB-262]|uniref:phosphodiester glycosidase family protein n=1 Tax=Trichocoleus sp. FACHB-262 TaxID=2692869 RepID=UPI001A7EBA73|nr:phosphodiester glycosidase family protein [Trichocoleus sp. FACHB-262]